MPAASLCFHPSFRVASVDPRIFGGFAEHMGRCIYQGLYEPGSAHADEQGWRSDVLAALKPLSFTAMRYPGGNFASGYHWQDGIGPRSQRPTVRELAWQSIEPNTVGTDEFLSLCERMAWQPMIAVNLGTGTPEEARNWVEYCNSPAGTKYADMRVTHGRAEPWNVKLWCLGNEMDGPWQHGYAPVEHYAIRALQAAKMMRDVHPGVELVACGSSGPGMTTYIAWDQAVLSHLGEIADYISLHRYVGNGRNDTPDFLATGHSIDKQIEEIDAVCRTVAAAKRLRKRTFLAFDEWNVWYKNMQMKGADQFAPHLIEEIYNLEDALVVGQFLNSFIRHADCVKIANIAQIVNVIAPLVTQGDDLLRQTIYYAMGFYATRRTGHALRLVYDGPRYDARDIKNVDQLDAAAILDDQTLHLFAINRSPSETLEVALKCGNGHIASLLNAEMLTGTDPKADNTFDHPNTITPQPGEDQLAITGTHTTLKLPPLTLWAGTLRLG